ncbi:ATP-binding protein [Phocaeicola sp.]
MNITDKILHEKQYADKTLEITKDTMFFVHKDGTCLDFKPNTPDFYIKEEDVIGKNIFSYFPVDTAREMHEEFCKVLASDHPSARNYKFVFNEEIKYYKCIISKFDDDHLIFQYRDITGRSVVRLNLEKSKKTLREVEIAAQIGQWSFNSSTQLFTYSGYTGVFCSGEEEKTIPMREYLQYIHKDDVERFKCWLHAHIHQENDKDDFLEYRLLLNGHIVNIRIKAYSIEAYKSYTIIEGYIQNISDIIQRSSQLELVTQAINQASEDIFAVTRDGKLYFGNISFRKHHGLSLEDSIYGLSAHEVGLRVNNKEQLEKNKKYLDTAHFIVERPYPMFPELLAYEFTTYQMTDMQGREIVWLFGRDISERIRNEQEQIEAKEKAEHSNQLKSAFLANMSHEIRTPLNAILGFSRIIAETDKVEERLQYYDIVERNNMRLQELINEILDLSKIESGMMEFNYAPVNLYTLCDDVKSTYRFRCQSGVELIFEQSDRSLYVSTDRNRLFQVFSNLIGNATKFTHTGSIRFGFKKVNDRILFHVTDTGSGISPDRISKIFDRFIMANDHTPGTGLGLSISKIIIEKLGGKYGSAHKLMLALHSLLPFLSFL